MMLKPNFPLPSPGFKEMCNQFVLVRLCWQCAALEVEFCPQQGRELAGKLEGLRIEAPVGGLQAGSLQVINRKCMAEAFALGFEDQRVGTVVNKLPLQFAILLG